MGLIGSILKSAALRKLGENIRKAEAGDPRAQHMLGFTYERGNGVPQNYAEAAKWYQKAAEQDYSTAQLNLGNLLAEGRGVEQDLTEAYKWMYLARLHPRGWFERDAAIQHLDRLRALMTPDQIAEGQKLVRLCRPGMSYDFRLFKRKANEDPLDTARAYSGFSLPPPEPQKEAMKRRVADALIARNLQLHVVQFDYAAVAKARKISEGEARIRLRHLELNGPEENCNGIQITLFDDEASVTVPFCHEGDKAADTFREIWRYLEIISREADYLVYDPQIDRVIDPSAGFEDALACYAAMRQTKNTLPVAAQ
jgi:Sel1 repeat